MMDPDAVTVRSEDGLATFDWPQILSALDDVASGQDLAADGPEESTTPPLARRRTPHQRIGLVHA